MVDYGLLEFCAREHLNRIAPRLMAVLDPVKVVIENYPEGQVEEFEMPLNPEDESQGTRMVPFSRELYIERDDFREQAPNKKFFRLAIGKEVRLRYAYYITCNDVVKDEHGNITELRCTYDPATRGGWSDDGRKVKGTLHWVSAAHAVPAQVRLYDKLFTVENPNAAEEGKTFVDYLNPDSLSVVTGYLEPALKNMEHGSRVQFERIGYFCVDPDSTADAPVFNRTVTLKDSWAKIANKQD
jgi:glutaminyl-tRNA synthetase